MRIIYRLILAVCLAATGLFTTSCYIRISDKAREEIRQRIQVSEKVYDTMLKSYGQELGVRSYGAVVDLLIAWYQAGMLG